MQAYTGIYNQGQFVPQKPSAIPGRNHTIVTAAHFPVTDFTEEENPQLMTFDTLHTEIHESGEKVPELDPAQI